AVRLDGITDRGVCGRGPDADAIRVGSGGIDIVAHSFLVDVMTRICLPQVAAGRAAGLFVELRRPIGRHPRAVEWRASEDAVVRAGRGEVAATPDCGVGLVDDVCLGTIRRDRRRRVEWPVT